MTTTHRAWAVRVGRLQMIVDGMARRRRTRRDRVRRCDGHRVWRAAPSRHFTSRKRRSPTSSRRSSRKQITTVEVVNLYLARIKAYNGTCVNQPEGLLGPITTIPHAGQFNALGTLNLRPATRKALGIRRSQGAQHDRSRRTTTRRCRTRWRSPRRRIATFAETGKLVGPLHGVVMSIKDWYDTFDMRTTAGADVLFANDRPPRDATFIKRLRAGGRDHSGQGERRRARSRATRSAASSATRTTRSARRGCRARAAARRCRRIW